MEGDRCEKSAGTLPRSDQIGAENDLTCWHEKTPSQSSNTGHLDCVELFVIADIGLTAQFFH
jgi:hypothetical protein